MRAAKAYIAFGSNLGDRRRSIERAIEVLSGNPEVSVRRVSSIVETEPDGGPPGQGPYLNGAAEIETALPPRELLGTLMEIERSLGRVRIGRRGPRTIDLDLLIYGSETVNEPGLTIPHPRMHERAFVLGPLSEIAPDAVHPVLRKTARELLEGLPARSPGGGDRA